MSYSIWHDVSMSALCVEHGGGVSWRGLEELEDFPLSLPDGRLVVGAVSSSRHRPSLLPVVMGRTRIPAVVR